MAKEFNELIVVNPHSNLAEMLFDTRSEYSEFVCLAIPYVLRAELIFEVNILHS